MKVLCTQNHTKKNHLLGLYTAPYINTDYNYNFGDCKSVIILKGPRRFPFLWCFAAISLWRFSLLHDVELCKLLWLAFLWGRTIKNCAIKLCLDVYGIQREMAIKSKVKSVYFSKDEVKKRL